MLQRFGYGLLRKRGLRTPKRGFGTPKPCLSTFFGVRLCQPKSNPLDYRLAKFISPTEAVPKVNSQFIISHFEPVFSIFFGYLFHKVANYRCFLPLEAIQA